MFVERTHTGTTTLTGVGLEHARNEAAAVLDQSCRNHGFFFVRGHGIPETTTTQIREASTAFFLQPEELKAEIAMKEGGARGYQHLGRNLTQGKKDQHEAIDFFRELPEGHTLRSARAAWAAARGHTRPEHVALYNELLAGRNLFPSTPANGPLQPMVEDYTQHMLGPANNKLSIKMAQTSGFEMYFAPSTFGAGGPNQNTSRIQHIKEFNPHLIYDTAFLGSGTRCCR